MRADVIALAEQIGAPVATTFKGKGLIPDTHPNAAGVLGRSGTPVASWFMNECDLILALGSSFANHTGIEPSKPIIQVDFERMQLGKFHPVALPIWGEIGAFARLVSEKLSKAPIADDQLTELKERWRIWREEKVERLNDDRGEGVSAAAVFATLTERCPSDAIIAVGCRQQHLLFWPVFRTVRAVGLDVRLFRVDRVCLAGGNGRLGRHPRL